MDGGPEQRRMAERLRHTIRRNSQFRRERNAKGDGNRADFIVETGSPDKCLNASGDDYHRNDLVPVSGTAETGQPNSVLMANRPNLDASPRESRKRSSSPLGEHSEIAFLAKYIDDIFPFLFPFYRPSMMETGRSWLLLLSQHSDVARHAMLCLAAYFFAVFLKDEYPGQHDHCRREIWTRLGEHTSGYVGKIQRSIEQLRAQPESTTTGEKARSMEGIVQAILFEAALGYRGTGRYIFRPLWSSSRTYSATRPRTTPNRNSCPSYVGSDKQLGTPPNPTPSSGIPSRRASASSSPSSSL